MLSPYLILGLTADADDRAIRLAYLEGIRKFPPERDPERFQAIARAYEQLRDPTRRLEHFLFNRDLPGDSPAETLARFCAAAPPPPPLPFEEMKAFLRACTTRTT